MLTLIMGAMAAFFYYSQMVNKTIIPNFNMLDSGREADLDILKRVTKPRQPGAMTSIIQDQSMTGKSKAAIRNPYGPDNSRAFHVNAPEVVQKKGYQTDYKRQLHATQVRFSTYNDHFNSFQQSHSPMDGILTNIYNFSKNH